MKKLPSYLTTLACMMLSLGIIDASPITNKNTWFNSTVDIQQVWTEHNEYENNQKGMRIYVKFSISGMRGKDCRVVAYFYHENGSPVKDENNSFNTSSGNASCGKSFTPPYDNTSYKHFGLFMPYDELHLDGKFDLKYYVAIWGNGRQLESSDYRSFTLDWNAPSRSEPQIKLEENGSLSCEIECPKGKYACNDFVIHLSKKLPYERIGSYSVSSAGYINFSSLTPGTYMVVISFRQEVYKDSKTSDSVGGRVPPALPFRNSERQVVIKGGERSRVKFE